MGVPIIKEQQKTEIEKFSGDPAAAMKQSMQAASAFGGPMAGQEEMFSAAMAEFAGSGSIPAALKRAQERATEYLPEYVRSIFKFLDLDENGTITEKEVQLLKAVLDALLHLGERPVSAVSAEGAAPVEGSVADSAKTLCATVFDAVDRDGDGKLSVREIVLFVQKLAALVLGSLRVIGHISIECVADELVKAIMGEMWKKQGMTEVEKEQLMMLVMMGPAGLAMMA